MPQHKPDYERVADELWKAWSESYWDTYYEAAALLMELGKENEQLSQELGTARRWARAWKKAAREWKQCSWRQAAFNRQTYINLLSAVWWAAAWKERAKYYRKTAELWKENPARIAPQPRRDWHTLRQHSQFVSTPAYSHCLDSGATAGPYIGETYTLSTGDLNGVGFKW